MKTDLEILADIHEAWCDQHAIPHMSATDVMLQCSDLIGEDMIHNLEDQIEMELRAKRVADFIKGAKMYGVLS